MRRALLVLAVAAACGRTVVYDPPEMTVKPVEDAGVITSATQVVPGGTTCVPQVPSGTTVSCGTILEALKYEKRMETAYSSFGRWWIDGRGWGDLIEASALEYPVPYQEMQSRQKSSYNLGGGFGSSAAKGTYGF